MLIDWITARLPMEHINQDHWQKLRTMTERVVRFKPDEKTQIMDDVYFLIDRESMVYETSCWDSIRSDSHQIAFRVGSDAIWIQGSPARVCGSGDAVFGEGAAGQLDLKGCLDRMASFVISQINLPIEINHKQWIISRIDITGNLLLDSLSDVRIALKTLRECEGGRYRVSQQAGDTVYWSHKSRLRSGKAYAKGPHIEYQTTKPTYTGKIYTEEQKKQISRLLRLELKLGAQFMRERTKPWYEISKDDLIKEWNDYFKKMIGDSEMKSNDDVEKRCLSAAKTVGRGKAAYCCFLLIQSKGWEHAKTLYKSSTWYDHLKVLRSAGLGDCDISAGNVVQLRRRVIECQMINTWSDFDLHAA